MEAIKPIFNYQQHHIFIWVYPGCLLLNISDPFDVFKAANIVLQREKKVSPNKPAYSVSMIAKNTEPVETSSGLQVFASHCLGQHNESIETLMVAGAAHASYVTKMVRDNLKDQDLLHQMPALKRIVAINNGTLAISHLNDQHNRPIQVYLDEKYICGGKIYLSGKIRSGIDLSLSLIEQDWGAEIATLVAKEVSASLTKPANAPYSNTYQFSEIKSRKDFHALEAWIVSHPEENLSVESLAKWMAMSPRNFSRLFSKTVGMSPGKFVQQVRLEAARNLILHSKQPIKSIAVNCGFRNPEQMRKTFQRLLKTSPQATRTN